MQEPYKRIAYVWDPNSPIPEAPQRLTFRPVQSIGKETFSGLVAAVMADALDRSDRKEVATMGASEAARQMLSEASEWFDFQADWWQVASGRQGQLVGFVLPVLIRGEEKYGLGDGTFYYLGVLPGHRGNGYIIDLLIHGTATLHKIGECRIFSDTVVNNAPMMRAFLAAGYQQHGAPKSVPL